MDDHAWYETPRAPVEPACDDAEHGGAHQLQVGAVLAVGTDTVLKTKVFGLKVRHFNNSCLLIAFTRSIHALFSM